MNVSAGDLAIVVTPYVIEGRGAFVTVVRLAPLGETMLGGIVYHNPGNSWIVDGWVHGILGMQGPQCVIGDNCLKRVPKLSEYSADDIGITKQIEVTA